MNYITYTFRDEKGTEYELVENNDLTGIEINNEFMEARCKKCGINKLTSCTMKLGVANVAVIIKDYSMTDTISIGSFFNVSSYISILQAKGISISVSGQKVKHMQLDCKNTMISDCSIDKLEIGLQEEYVRLKLEDRKDIFKVETFDLRDTICDKVDVYAECKNINIQGCNIRECNYNGNMFKEFPSCVEKFNIWQNTEIVKLVLSRSFNVIQLEDSTISNITARSMVQIEKLKIKDAIIQNCYGFLPETFSEPAFENWILIKKSAINSNEMKIRAEANYQMAKYQNMSESKGNKWVSWIFDKCAGYGYKPLRVIATTGVLAIVNTIVFSIIRVSEILCIRGHITINIGKAIKMVWNIFLLALAALAGQTGFSISDGAVFWFAIIEYLLSVVLFAVFVNALYARYKE